MRCKVTSNPVGTDTWAVGFVCPCDNCQKFITATWRFTIEPHGNSEVLYYGRDQWHHGYNLATVNEVSYNALPILNKPINQLWEVRQWLDTFANSVTEDPAKDYFEFRKGAKKLLEEL